MDSTVCSHILENRENSGKRFHFTTPVKCSRAVRHMSLPTHDPARHLQEHSTALLLGAVGLFKKGREVTLVLLVITISPQALLRLGDVLSWALRAA